MIIGLLHNSKGLLILSDYRHYPILGFVFISCGEHTTDGKHKDRQMEGIPITIGCQHFHSIFFACGTAVVKLVVYLKPGFSLSKMEQEQTKAPQ